jgi:hypothetical protein
VVIAESIYDFNRSLICTPVRLFSWIMNRRSSYLPVYMKLKTDLRNKPPSDRSSRSGIEVGIAATVEGRITSGLVRGLPGPRRFAVFA